MGLPPPHHQRARTIRWESGGGGQQPVLSRPSWATGGPLLLNVLLVVLFSIVPLCLRQYRDAFLVQLRRDAFGSLCLLRVLGPDRVHVLILTPTRSRRRAQDAVHDLLVRDHVGIVLEAQGFCVPITAAD